MDCNSLYTGLYEQQTSIWIGAVAMFGIIATGLEPPKGLHSTQS
jgi:hypothetical protein